MPLPGHGLLRFARNDGDYQQFNSKPTLVYWRFSISFYMMIVI